MNVTISHISMRITIHIYAGNASTYVRMSMTLSEGWLHHDLEMCIAMNLRYNRYLALWIMHSFHYASYIYIYVFMYVYMYLCMSICIYVCLYVFLYVYMYFCMYMCMYRFLMQYSYIHL